MGKHIKTFETEQEYFLNRDTFTEKHVAFIRETKYVDFGDYSESDDSNLNEFGLEGDLIITAQSNPPVFAALNDAGIPYDTTAGGYTIADLAAITDEDLMPLDEYDEASKETTVFYNKPIVNFNEFKYFTGIDGSCFYESANDVPLFGHTPTLKQITIPSNISCEEDVFMGCFYYCVLDYIAVEEGNQLYDSRGNCNAVINKSTNTLVRATNNTTIPTTVTAIGESAFSRLTINTITIPEHITEIGEYAFQYCENLTSATILGDITEISRHMFYNCKNLISFTIPNSVTSIGLGAFNGCISIPSITIPSSVTSIGDYAFSNCSSMNSITCNATTPPTISSHTFQSIGNKGVLTVPTASEVAYLNGWIKGSTNYYLGKYGWIINDIVLAGYTNGALYNILNDENHIPHEGCSFGYRISHLAAITDSDLISEDDNDTDTSSDDSRVSIFYNASDLTSFNEFQYFTGVSANILNSITYQYDQELDAQSSVGFFEGTNITKIVLPSRLTHIGFACFKGCPLEEIALSESMGYIMVEAFMGCDLTSIELPSSVKLIAENSLACPNLTEIICHSNTAPTFNSSISPFGNTYTTHIPRNGVLKYPEGADYSSWLSKSNYFLGSWGWTYEEI